MFYSLTKRESKELVVLEREFFYSNGIQKKKVSFGDVEKVIKLQALWKKQRELKMASLN
tara:strand:+ start:246 stop:422 length:177 start_codon:yes stop_codon:yes gene_type:complete